MDIVNDEVVEVWREVPEFPHYQVSDLGRVRSLDRRIEYRDGRHATHRGKVLKLALNSYGYHVVSLCFPTGGNKHLTVTVHQIVARAFISNPSCKPHVNHLDGVKTNNKISNLEWATVKENCVHAQINGLLRPLRGSKHPSAKLSEEDVFCIRKRIEGLESLTQIAKSYCVSVQHISDIKLGRRWEWLN